MRITKEEVVTKLGEIVQEYGEDHTAACFYTTNTEDGEETIPLCIAGVLFSELGVDIERLIDLDWGFGQLTYATPSELKHDIGLDLKQDAYDLLASVQRYQDDGSIWGEALKVAMGEQA